MSIAFARQDDGHIAQGHFEGFIDGLLDGMREAVDSILHYDYELV